MTCACVAHSSQFRQVMPGIFTAPAGWLQSRLCNTFCEQYSNPRPKNIGQLLSNARKLNKDTAQPKKESQKKKTAKGRIKDKMEGVIRTGTHRASIRVLLQLCILMLAAEVESCSKLHICYYVSRFSSRAGLERSDTGSRFRIPLRA